MPTSTRPPNNLLRRPSPWITARLDWLERAARLRGKALAIALVIWRRASVPGVAVVLMAPIDVRGMGVSRDAFYDGLTRLTAAGLIATERQRGRTAEVIVLGGDGEPLVFSQLAPPAVTGWVVSTSQK